MATKMIELSPLPPGTSPTNIQQTFSAYKLERICVLDDKGYL